MRPPAIRAYGLAFVALQGGLATYRNNRCAGAAERQSFHSANVVQWLTIPAPWIFQSSFR